MRRRIRQILAVAALGLSAGAVRAESAGPESKTATAADTAALAALDRIVARFEALLAQDDDAPHRAATQPVIEDLRRRRDAIRAAFDQSKYDELRVDLNLEYQRMAAWMARPATLPLKGSQGPGLEIRVFQLDPKPSDPVEVKAALVALDREIQREEARTSAMGEGAARESLRQRLEAVKRGRHELGRDFTKARWEAVIRLLKR